MRPEPSALGFQPGAITALAVKELRGYFESPTAYVALFVFYLLTSYLFAAPLFLVGQASIKGLTDYLPLLMMFLVPALTMGLLAEEMKSGTFETLATMPLEDWDIALGKFAGFAGLHAAAVAGLLFFPLALAVLAAPPASLDWGETAGVLCGAALTGWMFGAIGLFASSLGKNQIVAFVTSFLLCFGIFSLGKFSSLAPGLAGRLFDYAGLDSHIDSLAKGVLDSRDLVYFSTMTFGFLYMTVRRLGSRRL